MKAPLFVGRYWFIAWETMYRFSHWAPQISVVVLHLVGAKRVSARLCAFWIIRRSMKLKLIVSNCWWSKLIETTPFCGGSTNATWFWGGSGSGSGSFCSFGGAKGYGWGRLRRRLLRSLRPRELKFGRVGILIFSYSAGKLHVHNINTQKSGIC